MALYALTSDANVVRNTVTGQLIPFDAENKQYAEYLIWAGSNTPDAAPTESLAQAKARNDAEIDLQAEVEFRKAYSVRRPFQSAVEAMVLEEARRVQNDGSPADADYPLLKGMVDEGNATDLANAGTLVRGDLDDSSVLVKLGQIRSVQKKAKEDVQVTATVGGADAVVAAIVWPS